MQSYFKDKDKLFKQRRSVGGSSYSNFAPGVCPVWTAGHQYTKGMTVMNETEGNLYWCIQNHYADQVFDPLFWILIGGSAVTSLTDHWVQTGMVTNLFSTTSEDYVDWSGTLSPTGTQRGVLPLPNLDGIKLIRVQMKWLSETAVVFGADDSFTLQGGYITPTDASVEDANFSAIIGAENLGQWTVADNGTHPYSDSGDLEIEMAGGRLFAIRGRAVDGSGTLGPSNAEAQITCTFQIGPQ